MTEAQLKVFTLEVLCPYCGYTDQKTLSELISNNIVTCRVCNGPIDLSSQEWRTRISEAAEDIRKMHIPKA